MTIQHVFKSDIWIAGIGMSSEQNISANKTLNRNAKSTTNGRNSNSCGGSSVESLTLTMSSFRYMCSIALCLSYVALGFSDSYLGTSLLDLQYLLNTETKTIVLAFMGDSAGYFIGAIVGGYLVDRLSHVFYFVIASVALAASLAILPWMLHLAALISFVTLNSVFQGMTDTGAQVVVLSQWKHSKFKDSFLQAVHLMNSVGGMVGPFILEPFLSNIDLTTSVPNNTGFDRRQGISMQLYNASSPVTYAYTNNSAFHDDSRPSSRPDGEYDDTNVQLGILTLSCLCCIPATLWVAAFVKAGCQVKKRLTPESETQEKFNKTNNSKSMRDKTYFKVVVICFMVAFYFFYINVEQTTGNLLATFVIKGLGWTKNKGPLITSVYWGCHGVGSLSGVILAKRVKPATLLYADIALMVTSTLIAVFLFKHHEAVVWTCMISLALGSGSVFAAGFSFVDQYISIDGVISGAVQCAISLSMMTMTPLTGFLFDTIGPSTMVYGVFASTLACLVILIGLHTFMYRNQIADDEADSCDKGGSIDGVTEKLCDQQNVML